MRVQNMSELTQEEMDKAIATLMKATRAMNRIFNLEDEEEGEGE